MIARAAVVLALVSEALAFYVVSEWIAAGYRSGQQHAIPAAGFIAVTLIAFGLPRLVERLDLRPRVATIVMAVAAYVVLYGTLRLHFSGDPWIWDLSWMPAFVGDAESALRDQGAALVGGILLVAAWARAAWRSREEIELETLSRSVGLPFIVVTLVLVVSAYTDRAEVARAGAAYYGVAVLALAFAQLSLSGSTFGDLRAGGAAAILVGGVIGVTVGCVLLFWILFGLTGPYLGPPIEFVATAVLIAVFYPVAWVLEKVFALLFSGASPLDSLPFENPGDFADAAREDPDDGGGWRLVGTYLLRSLALLAVVAVGAGVIAFVTRLRRRAGRQEGDGSTTGVAGALGEDLGGLLRGLLRRRPDRGGAGTDSAARRLYLDVLERSRRAGAERAEGETPGEFAPRLRATLQAPVTDEITALFEASRYAGREPDARTVRDLERRWRELT